MEAREGCLIYPYILLIFVIIFFSGNILVGKAINELPPFTIAFFRLAVAFIVILPIGLRGAIQYRHSYMEHKKPFLIITLTGITFFNTFIYGALQFTSSTNVSVLETVIPVATVVLSAFLLKEKLAGVQWLGIVLSLIGAVWVVMDGRILQLTLIDWNIGDVIMIGAILTWAVYSIMVKQYMHLFQTYGTLLVMTGVSVVVLFPIVLTEWLVVGMPSLDISKITGLLYLGIFPSFIALSMYNRAVELTSASKSAVFLNFLPVVTMVGAYFWLGESITPMQIVGALVVIGGVILTTQFGKSQKELEQGIDLEN
ncbi:DMT family transporter [Thalassobacillus devorans]|uniref:DMT family transporter n=1 Tax=Thalassobacillus devorans TaxID=279813 RepID=UPI0020CAB848|nr:DMT family transporter [Thalassobacillus devorans]